MKLEVRNLCCGYGGVPILDGVTFTVPSGCVATLLGPNGCGKSTLLKTVGRMLRPQNGSILLDGRALSSFDTGELARKLAMLPQLHQTLADLSVEELVSLGRYPHRRWGRANRRRDREAVAEAIELTRLEPLKKRRLGTLSGGERQKAWIAMALAQEPELLLLDEPTTFLDVCCQFEIIELVRRLNRERHVTVLLVLHDLNLAADCSDELVLFKSGRIYASGAPGEVLTPEILREVFSIESVILPTERGVPYCMATGSTRA